MSTPRRRLPRRWKIALALIAIVVAIPVACIVFIATFDWNRVKPWLESRGRQSLGRTLEIGGDIRAAWHWRRTIDDEDRFAPGFSITASSVRIGNPDWATLKRFADLGAIDVDVKLLPLLWHHLDLPAVRLSKPSIDIEQRKDGSNTWTFVPTDQDTSSAWTLDIGDVAFDEGEVTVIDESRALNVRATLTRLDQAIPFGQRVEGDDPSTRRAVIERVGRAAAQRLHKASEEREQHLTERGRASKPVPPYLFAMKAVGTLQGQNVSGDGRIGGVLSLKEAAPFPVRADLDVGATQIALTGTITDPTSPDAIDMRLWINGANLADLYAITGIALPRTPSYATVGRLAGHFRPRRSTLRYQDFTARVGGSDLAGTLKYESEGDRATLSGDVDSTLLQFRDLGTLIGAGPATAKTDRVLPSVPFNVEHWKAMDAEVHFTGKRVVRTQDLPINDVDTHIRMHAGSLTLDPLKFAMAGGNVNASIRIDAGATPPKGTIKIEGKGLQLHRLFEKVDGLSDSPGEIDGDIHLAGSGNSIAALLGHSDGALRLLTTGGRVSETLMEEAGLNFANVLIEKIKGDHQIDIDCGAAAFIVKNGTATADLFVFDTSNALIDIGGTIDLGSERIDLTLHPNTKGMRIFSLRSPLHVQGTFEHLDVSVDKKSLLARGGGAVGLGLLAAPLALVLPLIAPGDDGDQKSCQPLVTAINGDKDAASKSKAKQPTTPSK